MSEKNKSEISPQKRVLKLTPSIGDWTNYKPPKSLVKKLKLGLYGFDRLSSEELKQMHLLHYKFAIILCKFLKENLKIGAELYSIEGNQNTYGNFLKNFVSPIFQGKINSSNYSDEIFVSFDFQIIDVIINTAIGLQNPNTKPSNNFTDADEIILKEIINEPLSAYYDSLRNTLQNPAFEKVSYPDLTQDFSINPQTTFVCFIIELTINGILGKITFGYSGNFIKSILKNINSTKRQNPLLLSKIPSSIFNLIELPITASIGKTSLLMSEIKNLEPGDVISFDQNIENAIPVHLFNSKVLLGQAGIKNNKIAVKLVALEKEKTIKITPPSYETSEEKEDKSFIELEEENRISDKKKKITSLSEEFSHKLKTDQFNNIKPALKTNQQPPLEDLDFEEEIKDQQEEETKEDNDIIAEDDLDLDLDLEDVNLEEEGLEENEEDINLDDLNLDLDININKNQKKEG